MRHPRRREVSAGPPLVGWREWVQLPALTDQPVKAKVDTGARTSSLHAFDLVLLDHDLVRFEVHPHQDSDRDRSTVTLPLVEMRDVRPSTGEAQLRPVVLTDVRIGQERFEIELTLSDRDSMGFRMLLGRTALAGRFLVDPSASFCQGRR